MPDKPDSARPRGFLSESDRRYLREPDEYADEYSRQSVKERREAIRERTRNALLDFVVLFEELEESEREEIFDQDAHDLYRLWGGMVAATAFFYELHVVENWEFDHFLTQVVEEMWTNHHRGPGDKIIVEKVPWDPPLKDLREEERILVTAKDKLLRGETPTNAELGVLVKRGGLLFDRNLEEIREHLDEVSREQYREEMGEKIKRRQEMFGEGYSIPLEVRKELEEEENETGGEENDESEGDGET